MTNRECDDARKVLAIEDRLPEIADDIARHLDACSMCRRLFDAGRVDLDPAAFERLSAERREAMVAALAARRAPRWRRWAAAAAVLVAVAGVLIVSTLGPTEPKDAGRVASAFVEDHIRYLRSEDRRAGGEARAVAATLAAYVDFPMRIPDVREGSLTGSRQCYLLDRRAALLFYDTPAGALSYFVVDGDGLDQPGRPCGTVPALACAALKGYRVVSWEKAGLLHAVVGPDSGLVDLAAEAARESLDRHINSQPTQGDPRP